MRHGERRRAVERRDVGDSGNQRQRGARTSCNDDALRSEPLTIHVDAASDEPGLTFSVGYVVVFGQEVGVFRLTQSSDQSVLLGDLCGPIDHARAPLSMPANRVCATLAWCTASVARINAFEGTQPILTQVPPIVPYPMSATCAPCSAAVIAAEKAGRAGADDHEVVALSFFAGAQQSLMI